MILHVRVIPRSSRKLIKEEGGRLKAYLTKPAQDGEANRQLIELLAEYFGVKKYQIEIIKGLTSRDKEVKLNDA